MGYISDVNKHMDAVSLCLVPMCVFQHPTGDTAESRLHNTATLHTGQPCKLCCTPGLSFTTVTCSQSASSVPVSFLLDGLSGTAIPVDSRWSFVSLADFGVCGRLCVVWTTQRGAIKN